MTYTPKFVKKLIVYFTISNFSPRASIILRKRPALGSTIPCSILEMYDLFVPILKASSLCVIFSDFLAIRKNCGIIVWKGADTLERI